MIKRQFLKKKIIKKTAKSKEKNKILWQQKSRWIIENGRDSAGRRLGVKRYGEQIVV